MDFGDSLKQEGWTIVTLPANKAIEFHFTPRNQMADWLSDLVPKENWHSVSFRRLAFRDLDIAVLFKLSCC